MFNILNNDFKLLSKYKKFLLDIDGLLENVPRKDLFYKDKIKETGLELLDNILKASYDEDKSKYFVLAKSNMALLDFEIERLHDKGYISEKAMNSVGLKLVEINRMLTAWINNGGKNDKNIESK